MIVLQGLWMGGILDSGLAQRFSPERPASAWSHSERARVHRVSNEAAKQAEAKAPAEAEVAGTAGKSAAQERDAREAGAQTDRFAISQYLVDGNTLLPQDKIDAVLSKHKGSNLQFRDIDQARIELEKAYQAAGYPTVLVNFPEQTLEHETVRLQVIEARLLEIKVTGNEYFDTFRIRKKLPSVKIGTVLYEPALVKELSAVNANPDLKVVPVLKPGSVPGTVGLELKVKDRLPVHGKLEADNRGPVTTPRNRLVAEIQHANVFGGGELLTVNTVQTPTDWGAVQNYGASFVYPVIWPSHLLAVYASKSQSSSVLAGSALTVGGGNVSIAGNATIAGLRYMFPVLTGGDNTHQLSIGVDYKRLEKTTATFPGGLGTVTVLSPVQYTPASLTYTGFFPDPYGLNKVTATAKGYVAGIVPGGDKADFAGDPSDPFGRPGNRAGSTGTFAVLQGGVDRTQPLPADFYLSLQAAGQWASQPLIPAEQFFAGGMDTVRGYINYETAGDHGMRGRAELLSPELPNISIDRIWQRRRSGEWLLRVRGVVFYDAAHLWVAKPKSGQIDRFHLEGIGAGIRVKFPKDLGELKVDQGWALRDTPTTQSGHTFVHFSVGIQF